MFTFSTGQQFQIQNLLRTPFNLLARPIIVYKRPEQVVGITPSGYNYAYPQSGPKSNVQYIEISGMCSGTIEYLNLETDQVLDFVTADTRYIKGKQLVRVGVQNDGMQLFEECIRITFDNNDHLIVAGPQPRDMFGVYSYDYWMQQVD